MSIHTVPNLSTEPGSKGPDDHDKGFFADKGGYELEFVLGTACVALLVAGAGRFSADALALRGRRRPRWLRAIAQQ